MATNTTSKKWNLDKIRKTGLFNAFKEFSSIEDVLKSGEKGNNDYYDIETYEELADALNSIVESINEKISDAITAISEIED